MKRTKRIAFLSLVLAVLMTVSVLPVGMLTASAVTADSTWYTTETSDATPDILYVDDEVDLWSFAAEIEGDNNFAGKTIKLTNDVIVNEGWDAFAETVEVPSSGEWPLKTYNKKFAGTFDGQGHTISGLYVTGAGEGVGIFGNVATGTKATVKNVKIENSYVTSSGIGGVGGIFGVVLQETSTLILDSTYVNKTEAIVDNVYADINIRCTGVKENNALGTGGIIGGARADVEITNTTFIGDVYSTTRGVAAFVGSSYPGQGTYTGYSGEITYYRNYITIQNCVAEADIEAALTSAPFAGALVGYTNTITTHTFENVFSTCSITTGNTARSGELVGGSYWAKTDNSSTTTVENYYSKRNGAEDWQEFYFNNVHYQTDSDLNHAIGATSTAQKICNADKHSHATRGEVIDAIAAAVEDSLQQSISLKNNLSLNVYAMILDPDAEVTIGGVEAESTSDTLGRFTLDGILPQQMMDTFTLKVTQTILDETIVIQKNMSIRKYCEAFWEADFTTEAEKDLIADLLRYGAAAQTYAEYNVENLATEGMDLEGYGSTVNVDDIQTKYAQTQDSSDYAFTQASLRMDNSIEMRLMFTAADKTDVTVTVAVNGKTQTFDADDFVAWGSDYFVTFDKIYAHEMETAVTATITKGSTEVATLTYSVADYCKTLLSQDATGDEQLAKDQTMVKAMYTYGVSASAYNDSTRLVIIDGSVSDYVIVYDDIDAAARDLALRFARELQAKTDVLLPVVDDTTENAAKEIIIGKADGRDEVTEVYDTITSYSGSRYGLRAKIVNSDIVVVAETVTDVTVDGTVEKTPGLLQEAVDNLLDEIRTHGGDTWGVGLDYSAQIDLPEFNTSDTKKVYYSNENNHTLSITGTSVDYDSYVAALKADGFVEYTTNEINGNKFGTYIKTAVGSDMVAYTAYYPDGSGYYDGTTAVFDTKETIGTANQKITTENLRITYGPLTFLPGTEEITASATGIRAIPSIMQPARVSSYMSAPGMCYIVQLLDGSFILIDGGYASGTAPIYTKDDTGTVSKTGSQSYDDAQAIYEMLVDMSPDEKPMIAVWLMSHTHADHINMSYTFMERYHDQVDVKMFAHNYPDEIACHHYGGNVYNIDDVAEQFNECVEKYYPDAQRWIVHTGQKLYLPGCDIEIFYTPEDFYGIYDARTFSSHTENVSTTAKGKTTINASSSTTKTFTYMEGECYFANGNETCIMFRITLGDTTFMVTGDSEDEICTQVGTRYQDALKSDIMQTPHHGTNGPELGFYEYVDPDIVFWSIDEFRFENDSRCNGYKGAKLNGTDDYILISNGTKYTKTYGIGSSYYANGWLRDAANGVRTHYAVNMTTDTIIKCTYPDDFVIETPVIPFW